MGTVVFALVRGLPGAIGRQARRWGWSSATVLLGQDVAVAPGVTLTPGSSMVIGRNSTIDSGVFLTSRGGRIQIGDRVSINRDAHLNADIGGELVIGDDALIGPRVLARTCNHCFDDLTVPINTQGHNCHSIQIGSGAWLGAGVILVPGSSVGENTVVGAGSVVVGKLPPRVIAAGNPAKVLRSRADSTKPASVNKTTGQDR